MSDDLTKELSAYSLDADPHGIRARAAYAIRGALAFGAQNINPAPDWHWLADFWAIGRAERSLSENGWLPIDTAPADELVAVFWIDPEGTKHHDLDYIEDECWSRWHDHAEHTEIIGGHGVSYTPPYTHWKRLGFPSTTSPKED